MNMNLLEIGLQTQAATVQANKAARMRELEQKLSDQKISYGDARELVMMRGVTDPISIDEAAFNLSNNRRGVRYSGL